MSDNKTNIMTKAFLKTVKSPFLMALFTAIATILATFFDYYISIYNELTVLVLVAALITVISKESLSKKYLLIFCISYTFLVPIIYCFYPGYDLYYISYVLSMFFFGIIFSFLRGLYSFLVLLIINKTVLIFLERNNDSIIERFKARNNHVHTILSVILVSILLVFHLLPPNGYNQRISNMNYPRTGHKSYLMPDGKVLILGGNGFHGEGGHSVVNNSSIELFNPKTNTFKVIFKDKRLEIISPKNYLVDSSKVLKITPNKLLLFSSKGAPLLIYDYENNTLTSVKESEYPNYNESQILYSKYSDTYWDYIPSYKVFMNNDRGEIEPLGPSCDLNRSIYKTIFYRLLFGGKILNKSGESNIELPDGRILSTGGYCAYTDAFDDSISTYKAAEIYTPPK